MTIERTRRLEDFVGRIVLMALQGLALTMFSPVAQANPIPSRVPIHGAQGTEAVQVLQVVAVLLPGGIPAHSVHFRYRFTALAAVHIQNLGLAPSEGQFRFLTADDRLVFRDATTKSTLAEIPLVETLITASKPPLQDIAPESEFPEAFRVYQWRGVTHLSVRANAVLNRHFKYKTSQKDGRTVLVTTFTPINANIGNPAILGRIALILSFPFNESGDACDLRVQSLVQEGRVLSDEFRSTSNFALIRAGDKFVESLVASMRREGST